MSTYYPDYDDDPPTVELPMIDLHTQALSDAPRKRTADQGLLRTGALASLILTGLVAAGVIIAAFASVLS